MSDLPIGEYGFLSDCHSIDASALMVPTVGLLPGTDPRVLGTIAAVKHRRCDERGFVRRYADGSDGFAGTEGAFVLCTSWLAHAPEGRRAGCRVRRSPRWHGLAGSTRPCAGDRS